MGTMGLWMSGCGGCEGGSVCGILVWVSGCGCGVVVVSESGDVMVYGAGVVVGEVCGGEECECEVLGIVERYVSPGDLGVFVG